MADNKVQIDITAKDTTGPAFDKASQGLKTLSNSADNATSIFAKLGPMAIASVAGFSTVSMIQQLHQAGMAAERLRNSFEAATGSMSSGAAAMAFVRATSQKLGLDLQSAADGFMKISAASKGTSMEGENTQQIFKAVAGASTALGLSAEQTNGALLAISQMMSKGTVQAEELRGQLGERLPGAFQIAARAMNVSTMELGKMLEGGKVVADDFLPKFAAELQKTFPPGEKAMAGLTAETNRLKTAWFELQSAAMENGGGSIFTSLIKGTRTFTEDLGAAIKSMDTFGSKFLTLVMPGIMLTGMKATGATDQYKPKAPLNAFEKAMSAPDFNSVGPAGGSSYLLGSGSNIMTPGVPITGPSDAALKEYDKHMKELARQHTYLWTLEKDLLFKNMTEYDKLKKEQYTYFLELQQNLEDETGGTANAFNLANMQTGELKTNRYKVTPLSKYRLMTNEQYSIPQQSTAFDKNAEADRLKQVYWDIVEAQQMMERYSPWEGMQAGITSYAREVEKLGDQYSNVAVNAMRQMEDALTNFVMTGKLNFNDLANSIISDLVRIQMKAAVSGVFNYLSSAVGSLFSPVDGARAAGGPVYGGSSYLVGERGPEIFTPGATGMITPNNALGGGGVSLKVEIINATGQQQKAKDGGTKFDGASMVKTIILEAMDTDPGFRWAMRGAQ
jgi:tape measure domain-containing protein